MNIFKRLIEIILAIMGLIVAIPIILVACLLVRLETSGKAIFVQKRVGINNKEYNLYKIRSMVNDAEKNGAKWASKNDSRITKVGSFIRKTRIDELPQLINVLKGDMSIIGPRPEREVFYKEFEKTIPNYRDRLKVKPGLTGWGQVNGGYDITPEEKLKFDLYYIENRSLKLDLIIVFKTIKVLVTGDGAR